MGETALKNSRFSKGIAIVLAFAVCFIVCMSLLADKPEALAEGVSNTETINLNYSDGAHYEGSVEAGEIRHGTGSLTWSTGESYEGTWVNDVQSGDGKMVWPGLGIYTGQFQNGKRQGHGIFTWTYDGALVTGQPVSFDGEWEDDHIGSSGTMVFANLGIYEGEFSKGSRSGQGTFTWDNGDQYFGTWAKDQISGEGILTLKDGSLLEGQFNNNLLTKGTVTYAVDGGMATRNVLNGKPQSAVTIVYRDDTTVVGTLKGQEFTGNVTITYASGDSYVGTLKKGVKSGKGTYTWINGAHYVGSWSNDKMSGTGKYYYGKDESKNYLSGTFKDGLPFGTLTYVSDKKLQYNTVWKDGKCTSITYKKK